MFTLARNFQLIDMTKPRDIESEKRHPADKDEIILQRGNVFFLRTFHTLYPSDNVAEYISVYDGNPHKLKWEAEYICTYPLRSLPDVIAGLKALSGKLKIKEK